MVTSGIVVSDGKAYLNYRDYEDAIQSGYYLMQFTGLKDKNERDIYEDDILRRDDGKLWHIGIAGFIADTHWLQQYQQQGELYEVIGNIYETPSLLTV